MNILKWYLVTMLHYILSVILMKDCCVLLTHDLACNSPEAVSLAYRIYFPSAHCGFLSCIFDLKSVSLLQLTFIKNCFT